MKSILVFSNGEKIGDGIIKLPLLNEFKRRLPNYKLYWMTDQGSTVYASTLKNIASSYIDNFFEKANLNYFFSRKISNKFDLEKEYFDIIFDTQKSLFRTLTLKRIKHKTFISGTASGIFSDIKLPKQIKNQRKYYLENLYDLLDLIVKMKLDNEFRLPLNMNIEQSLKKILKQNQDYVV
jgi:ADP-heptose:LPS heptosyltransferase